MSKPVVEIEITTLDEKSAKVQAVFDTGSFYSIVREDMVPSRAAIVNRATPRTFRTAAKGTTSTVTGKVDLVLTIGDKQIEGSAHVSPGLSQEMLVGAGTMQMWDLSIINRNGKTEVSVGRDMHDPQITEVD